MADRDGEDRENIEPVLYGIDGLEACPFCGRTGSLFVRQDGNSFFVICDISDYGCLATGPEAGTLEEAVELWNRRAEDDGE